MRINQAIVGGHRTRTRWDEGGMAWDGMTGQDGIGQSYGKMGWDEMGWGEVTLR